jgi:two-component system response regulator PilR (NtrC family)
MNPASSAHYSLLVVDDEPDLRTLYELTLLREGYEVEAAGSVEDALLRLHDRTYSAVITDMRLPDGTGLDLLAHIEAHGRREKAIVITAYGSAENAVEALKAGAYDYLTKPVDLRQFRAVVASALGRAPQLGPTVNPSVLPSDPAAVGPGTARKERASPTSAAVADAAAAPTSSRAARPTGGPQALARLRGNSPGIVQVRTLIDKVARSMAPVLVHGESGTGKELVARAIHDVSSRAAQPFIAVNCGAIPEQLLEAEFFGYRKGAFTGANEDRAGFFQAAQGGTLFLDEIGDLPMAMQSKLLRVIQERSVRPVGAVMEMPVNVRVVSATHKDLSAEVQSGHFRQDLYYRLNVIQLHVPPLRERLDDLADICDALLARIAGEAKVEGTPRLANDAMSALRRYSFPGNVRELENLLHRAVALASTDVISANDLGLPDIALDDIDEQVEARMAQVRASAFDALAEADADLPSDLVAYLDDVERHVLERALDVHRNNRTAAGASLGLTLRQMRYRMARLGIGVAGADPSES